MVFTAFFSLLTNKKIRNEGNFGWVNDTFLCMNDDWMDLRIKGPSNLWIDGIDERVKVRFFGKIVEFSRVYIYRLPQRYGRMDRQV